MPDLAVDTLPLLPLTSGVVLPQMIVTLALETDEARAAADAATSTDGHLLLVPRVDGRYATVGTVAKIENRGDLPSGVPAVIVRGVGRAVLGAAAPGTGAALWIHVDPVEDPAPTDRARELAREYRGVVETILEKRAGARLAEVFNGITDPGAIADTAGYWPDLSVERKIDVLETLDVEARLEKVLAWAKDALADLTVKEEIQHNVAEGMDKAQRQFVLRQQLAAIQKELGEDGDGDAASEFRAKVADLELPDTVRAAIDKEIDRLERMSDQSPEQGWIRTWLETITELPWGTASTDNLDVNDARVVLDADHTGLEDVKDRIVEYLAVRKLRSDRGADEATDVDGTGSANAARRGAGAIITLVGPPGVGKTSLGASVARALGRKFVRVALGGVHDEAEIRGHRRTYVGARAGRIVRALTEAGTMNPVVLLDEVDKLGSDWRGDPSSALLEVLDPAQNHTFRDHYLEVDLDLSDVLFIATANVLETIPGPLLDRMEVVRLDGYTEQEKVAIARDHLLPRLLKSTGLSADEVTLSDDVLQLIVGDYTREAGVRGLERELAKLLRKVAVKVSAGSAVTVAVTPDDVRTYLGRQKFFLEAAERTAVPGVATGLAVTGAGGDVLFVEATALPLEDGSGAPGLTLTGQLGDVMKESASIALSYVRSHRDALGVPAGPLRHVHLHVPAGAVPKDGPSAGVTMTTALVSLLTGRPVKATVGMTGEVTLQGKVLPIGGVKQKVLAAHRSGLTEVILPARNGGDLDDVPETVRQQMTFHLADDVTQVLDWALEPVEDRAAAA